MSEAQEETWTHPEIPEIRSTFRVEATPDGLKLCEFDPEYSGPVPYMSNFIKIPKELVPWFSEAVSLAANRSPLFP